ncbi:unnamed protein product [Ectocarpus fasciculatus]
MGRAGMRHGAAFVLSTGGGESREGPSGSFWMWCDVWLVFPLETAGAVDVAAPFRFLLFCALVSCRSCRQHRVLSLPSLLFIAGILLYRGIFCHVGGCPVGYGVRFPPC